MPKHDSKLFAASISFEKGFMYRVTSEYRTIHVKSKMGDHQGARSAPVKGAEGARNATRSAAGARSAPLKGAEGAC